MEQQGQEHSIPQLAHSIFALLQEQAPHLTASLDVDRMETLLRELHSILPASGTETRSGTAHLENTNQPRWQDAVMEKLIPRGSSVLDLGCGSGSLLKRLRESRQVSGQGIELDPELVIRCVANGVSVIQSNLDQGLPEFPDHSFDFVILEETLQTLHRPLAVLKEILRVGSKAIVSFPNFGYWQIRLDLVLAGRMPVTSWLPFAWFDTPNIHLFTLKDFLNWSRDQGVHIDAGYVMAQGTVRELKEEDNLYAEEALLVIRGQA